MDLPGVLALDAETFTARFRGSAIRRTGLRGLQRNALVVLGNLAEPRALPTLLPFLSHPDPMLRRHAAWSAHRLGEREAVSAAWSRERDEHSRADLEGLLSGSLDPREGST
jgi:epoxyqueuosine reductase